MAQDLNVEYSTITQVLEKVPSYYVEQGDGGYELYSIAEQYTITCRILGTDTTAKNDFEASYKNLLVETSSKDDAFLLGSLANKIPLVISRNSDGVPIQTVEPRVGSELIIITPNFCDKTTWYAGSVRSLDETLSDSGDGLTFLSAHTDWINLYSGLIFDEDVIVTEGYQVFVTVNDVTASMIDPLHPESGGDYSVNFVSGTITFSNDQTGNSVIASYSYASSSQWVIQPDPGKDIDIEIVEAQFSENIVFRDSIIFEIWAYNPNDLPNKALMSSTKYKSMRNFIDEALGSYPVIPPIGGNDERGIDSAIYGFPFRYGTIRRLYSSYGVELRIKLEHDKEFLGTHSTATFYCTVRESES